VFKSPSSLHITPRELHELITGYDITDPALAALAALSSRPGCWPQYRHFIPESFREFLALELAASEIWIYDPQQIPSPDPRLRPGHCLPRHASLRP
jgi:hypothetical protein